MSFLLFLILITLLYIAWKIPKKAESKEGSDVEAKRSKMTRQQLAMLKGATCELAMNVTSLVAFPGGGNTGRGVLVDFDDQWALFSCPANKGDTLRVFRISQIDEVREVR